MQEKACFSIDFHSKVASRFAAIDGVGGDTGVKPQHRYVTCPPQHRPHRRLDFFIVIQII